MKMIKTNNPKLKKLFFYFFLFSSLLCSMCIGLSDSIVNNYTLLSLLPLTYGLSTLLLKQQFVNFTNKVSFSIVLITYYIRLVILPFVIFLSNYEISLGGTSQVVEDIEVASNMSNAILIMCWEYLLVTLILRFFVFSKTSKLIDEPKTFFNRPINNLYNYIFYSLITFVIGSFIIYPDFVKYFDFFVSKAGAETQSFKDGVYEIRSIVPKVYYWLWVYSLKIFQILVPAYLILVFHLKYGKNYRILSLLFSLLTIILSFVLMTEEKVISIQIAFSLIIMIAYFYPKLTKRFIPFALVIIGLGAFYGLYIKTKEFGVGYENNLLFYHISGVVSAYFGGVANVATSLCINEEYLSFKLIVADVFQSIPFLNYFFKDWMSTRILFNQLILESGAYYIIPMIGQSKFYLGFLISPLFSIITVRLALFFERKADQCQFFLKRYVFLLASLMFAQSAVMYNMNIVISFSFLFAIVLFIVKSSSIKYYTRAQ